ncbi:MAG TPA: hypothetical protein VFL90_19465 [Methylomirabilota bacterium]|nr:hypothetical protein [Methylomirabilota bacterium]
MHAHSRMLSQATAVPDDASVAWTAERPSDEDAVLVWEAVTRRRLTAYGAVVDWVSEQMFRRDLHRLGARADAGFFEPFYRAHARQLLALLDGRVLQIASGAGAR